MLALIVSLCPISVSLATSNQYPLPACLYLPTALSETQAHHKICIREAASSMLIQ